MKAFPKFKTLEKLSQLTLYLSPSYDGFCKSNIISFFKVMGIGAEIFNFIGAVVRWIYGMTWRTIAGKKKFTFKEYLRGPDDSDDWFDIAGHEFVNRLIGAGFLMFLVYLTMI